MRIFITGATGFVGRSLVAKLSGHDLLSLSRSPQSQTHQKTHFLSGDLAHQNQWEKSLKEFAPVCAVHLAWEGLPDYSFTRCRTNLLASLELIERLADVGVRRIVGVGSCWEYGSVLGSVREEHMAQGCGVFAATKNSQRQILESFARERGIEYRWVRVFFVYGPGQRETSLIPLSYQAYANGKKPEIRNPALAQDFIYIDDVAEGLATLTLNEDLGSGVFNLGSGKPATVASVVNWVAKNFSMPPPFAEPDPTQGFWADMTKTFTATGWRPKVSLEEGVDRTLKDLRKTV